MLLAGLGEWMYKREQDDTASVNSLLGGTWIRLQFPSFPLKVPEHTALLNILGSLALS